MKRWFIWTFDVGWIYGAMNVDYVRDLSTVFFMDKRQNTHIIFWIILPKL